MRYLEGKTPLAMETKLEIATEKLFETYTDERVYSLDKLVLPKGDPTGFDSMIYLLSPSQNSSIALLNHPKLNFVTGKYRWYYIEPEYKEKIGLQKVIMIGRHPLKTNFIEKIQPKTFRIVPYAEKERIFDSGKNMIYDLGQWMEYFFRYRKRLTLKDMCTDFCMFLRNHIHDVEGYTPYVLLDLSSWPDSPSKKFRTTKKEDMVNPLNILVAASRIKPELLDSFGNLKLIMIDTKTKSQIIVPFSSFKKEHQKSLLSKLSKIERLHINANGVEEVDLEEDEKADYREAKRIEIINTMKKNFIGEGNDITADVDTLVEDVDLDADEEIAEIIAIDDESSVTDEEADIEAIASEYIDENPNLLEENPEEINAKIDEFIKTKMYIRPYETAKSDKQKTMIEKLKGETAKNLKRLPLEDLKSKTIDESKFDEFIDTRNTALLKSRAVNFDKSYLEKKFDNDVDAIIRQLETAEYPLFCVEKTVEDSSDQMNLKYTHTYIMKDMNGTRHTIIVDIPKIINNNHVFLKGSEKVIGHQMALKPLVKTGPDDVQIVCWYNKMFVHRNRNASLEALAMKSLFTKEGGKYKVRVGNNVVRNKNFITPLDFDVLAKVFVEFTVGDAYFNTDLTEMKAYCVSKGVDLKKHNDNKSLVIGYDNKKKEPIIIPVGEPFVPVVNSYLDEDGKKIMTKTKVPKSLMYTTCTINSSKIPAILFMYYAVGFRETMKRANIEWEFVSFKDAKGYHPYEYGDIQLSDGYIMWKRNPIAASLLMNGLQKIDMSSFTFEELESKDTFVALLSPFYAKTGFTNYLDQFIDFMMDDRAKELLEIHDLPTDLVSLISYASSLLTSNTFKSENHMSNIRIRSTELIPSILYQQVAQAYTRYRETAYKTKPSRVSIKKSCVIDNLLSATGRSIVDKGASNLVEEASSLNPVLTLEKNRAVSFKGSRGINNDRQMTLEKRGYDESMLGVLAITTSNDSNVGIMRQMTLEPNILNTMGEIGVVGEEGVENLNAANLFSPAEMLTPLSVQHDDPDRTAMTYKQSKYMVMTADSDPVYIGNKVESIVAYHMPDDFSIMAEDSGTVVEYKKEDHMTVKYSNGRYRTIKLAPKVKKNSAAGFWILSQFTTDLKVGSKFKKGQALAWDPKGFARNLDDRGISMRLGVFTKVAVAPNWDIFEDSGPVTKTLSERMATDLVDERKISLTKTSFVDWMVKIGDKVDAGAPMIRFDQERDSDEEIFKFMKNMKTATKNKIAERTMNTIHCKHTGEVVDIKVKSTVPIEDLDPSLQAILKDYNSRLTYEQQTLDKYSNPGDTKFYKSGNIITDIPETVNVKPGEKVNGKFVDEGVVISIYVKYKDLIKKGDKVCAEFALKGITSHVIEEGFEAWSEYRPEEEISHLVSPLAISARKVPSIFLAMYGNKCIVELKRQHHAIWKGPKPIKEKRKMIMTSLINAMRLLDPSGTNAEYYRQKFNKMSDKDYSIFYNEFFKDDKRGYYLEIIEFDRDLKIQNIEACAEYMGIPLTERIALPYLNHDKEFPVITPEPVPVGYINMKRMQQTLVNKTHGSIKIDNRNGKTGQVVGEDKNARNSDVETYGLLALGAKAALREFMTFRADDMRAKTEAYNALAQDGFLYLNDLTMEPGNRTALNTLDAYFMMQGILTNIHDKRRKPEDSMTVKLVTDKWIEENRLKQVWNPSYWVGAACEPSEGGLLDPAIFGEVPKDRMTKYGYIDLHCKVFHPYVYDILTRVFPRKIDTIVSASGQSRWIIKDGKLVEIKDPTSKEYHDQNTGLEWLVKNFKKLDLKKNGSLVREKRIDLLLELDEDEIFITKWPVMPIFYRDVDRSKVPASVPEETDNYRALLEKANSVDPDFPMMNQSAMAAIQMLLCGIRKSGQEKIAHKHGALHQSVLGKSIDYGARAVISVPTMIDKNSPDDMEVDILHSGIPLALCLVTGYPLIMNYLLTFFNEMFNNNPTISVLKKVKGGKPELVEVETGDVMNQFTQEYLDDKIEKYMNTFGGRFEPVSITLEDGSEVQIAFTGRGYGNDPKNPKASQIKNRALTWTDVFYIAAMETLTDKHAYITRYPLVDYFGIFPSRVMPVSTVKTCKMEVDGVQYQHYPVIDPTLSESDISTLFIDTVEISNLFLDAICGDYDGDTVSLKIVFSQEANAEAEYIINQPKQYISTGGSGVRFIGNEPYLTYFNMTKYA